MGTMSRKPSNCADSRLPNTGKAREGWLPLARWRRKEAASVFFNSTMTAEDTSAIQGYLAHSTGISGHYEAAGVKLAAEASS